MGFANKISCPTIKPFCGIDGDMGPFIQQLCPVTCGFCEDGEDNPRTPTNYRATSILYHAHLLGSEMYATLLRPEPEDDPDEEEDRSGNIDEGGVSSSMSQQQRFNSGNKNKMIVKDLQSSEFWNYELQEATPMENEYEIQVVSSHSEKEEQGPTSELVKGVAIVPGDHIQATCVYNSMYQEESTPFGVSTYDEMCIIVLQITFPTPDLSVNNKECGSIGCVARNIRGRGRSTEYLDRS